ncbi:hypothetical protein G9H25_17825 [Escherichia coli]|nr:hypothetical protein [Escherichia coli]
MKHIQIRNSDMAWHIAANNLGKVSRRN